MRNTVDLNELYSNRTNFTVIGLTGRNGSGYDVIAEALTKSFDELKLPDPNSFSVEHNSYKKYRIIHDFVKVNHTQFTKLAYRDFIILYLLKYTFDDFIGFISSDKCKEFILKYNKIKIDTDFTQEITRLNNLKSEFDFFSESLKVNDLEDNKDNTEFAKVWLDIFLSKRFETFSSDVHEALKIKSFAKHNLLLELLTNNIRKNGNPYLSVSSSSKMNIFSIVKLINVSIKFIRKVNGDSTPTKVVIDSLRNPFEINYFKQRFSAFYLIAVNRDEKVRETVLKRFYDNQFDEIKILLEDEYTGGKGQGFYKQYVRECIEKADIHITYRTFIETKKLNENRDSSTSPYFTWNMQLIKYLALIDHPGIITPSPEERCMQLAYTAKYNSGCISRQVGAAVTDSNYSVKAIGWNNTPEGQVPCNLRIVETLLNASVEDINELHRLERDEMKGKEHKLNNRQIELSSFTPFERNNKDFREALDIYYKDKILANDKQLKGRNVCFCFKSLHNSYTEGKNQVHTRSLHAEESAFLQITKYGGQPIKDGRLFTTASPCELCSKKAYQLGIKVIYYVDPYPGISNEQILEVGSKRPEVRLFNGAIGNAYHWLYEPLMAYKDELGLLLNNDIEDLTKKQKRKISNQEIIIQKLKEENEILKKQLEKKSNQ
jgi:deoxycytidylate deaminase